MPPRDIYRQAVVDPYSPSSDASAARDISLFGHAPPLCLRCPLTPFLRLFRVRPSVLRRSRPPRPTLTRQVKCLGVFKEAAAATDGDGVGRRQGEREGGGDVNFEKSGRETVCVVSSEDRGQTVCVGRVSGKVIGDRGICFEINLAKRQASKKRCSMVLVSELVHYMLNF